MQIQTHTHTLQRHRAEQQRMNFIGAVPYDVTSSQSLPIECNTGKTANINHALQSAHTPHVHTVYLYCMHTQHRVHTHTHTGYTPCAYTLHSSSLLHFIQLTFKSFMREYCNHLRNSTNPCNDLDHILYRCKPRCVRGTLLANVG